MPTLKWISLVPLLLLPLLALGQAAPDVTIELRDVDPNDASVLPLNTRVHGHITYRANVPVGLVLRAFRDGEPVLDGVYYSGSPNYPAPEGEGIAWFAFDEPQRIDEIRAIAVVSTGTGDELAYASVFRSISWRAGAAEPETAAWVAPLKQHTDDLIQAQELPPDEGGAFIIVLLQLLLQLLFLSVPGSVVLQIIALRVLQGTPKAIARLSALAMGLLWLFVIVTGLAGSNLSPIWLVFLSPLFVMLLVVLLVKHRMQNKRSASG